MLERRRNLLLRITFALLLGFVSTIAIAWGVSAYHVDFSGPWTSTEFQGRQGGGSMEAAGTTRLLLWGKQIRPDDEASPVRIAQESILAPAIAVVQQSRQSQPPQESRDEYVASAGWPFRALWYHAREGDDWLPEVMPGDPAIDITPDPPTDPWMLRALPLRPVWPGLAGDVLLFGSLWFLLLSIPALRRQLRRLRGRCCKCGYILSGIDSTRCPECGSVIARVK